MIRKLKSGGYRLYSRKKTAGDEMVSIFGSIGLTGSFWDPKSYQWKQGN